MCLALSYCWYDITRLSCLVSCPLYPQTHPPTWVGSRDARTSKKTGMNISLDRFARVATSELSSWLHFITRSHAFQNPGNLIWWDGNFNCTTNLRTWGLFINDVFTGEGRGGEKQKDDKWWHDDERGGNLTKIRCLKCETMINRGQNDKTTRRQCLMYIGLNASNSKLRLTDSLTYWRGLSLEMLAHLKNMLHLVIRVGCNQLDYCTFSALGEHRSNTIQLPCMKE